MISLFSVPLYKTKGVKYFNATGRTFASDYAEILDKANQAIQNLIDSYNKLDSPA